MGVEGVEGISEMERPVRRRRPEIVVVWDLRKNETRRCVFGSWVDLMKWNRGVQVLGYQ